MPLVTPPTQMPVREAIALNRFNVLKTVVGKADGGPYNFTLNVVRGTNKINPTHLTSVMWQLSPEAVKDSINGADTWWIPFAVVVYIMPGDDDTTPHDTYANAIIADLTTAVMGDYHCGGLAINTIIDPDLAFPPVEGNDYAGITFNFRVLYRHLKDQPYIAFAG